MAQAPETHPKSGPAGGGRTPRQERGERTRQRILEAALEVMADRGVGALTYRSVAEAAGVSLGVTTYYFASRRQLLAEAFKLHLDQMGTRGLAFEPSASASGSGRSSGSGSGNSSGKEWSTDEVTERIVDFLAAMIREERASVIASQELSLELTRDPGLVAEVGEALSAHRARSADLVARNAGGAPAEDAAIMSAVLDDLALEWIARNNDPTYEEHVRRVTRRLVELLFERKRHQD